MERREFPTRMFDIATQRVNHGSHRPCFRYGGYELSADAYLERANAVGMALLGYGLQRGEVVAIICDNRPEWNIIDIGVMQAGGVLMPLCKGLSAEEYVQCLSQAAVRLLFIEDDELLERFRIILPQVASLERVVTIAPGNGGAGLDDFCRQPHRDEASATMERRRNMVTTDDICTLVYTGGGTYSKLTHRMLLADVAAMLDAESSHRHTCSGNNALCTRYGRAKNYMNQMIGRTVDYPEH